MFLEIVNHQDNFYIMKLMNIESKKDFRKNLRNNATTSEKRLWKFLNKKQQDFKFRRQHGIGPFIVDFYLPNKKIAIEIDGSIHNNIIRQAYDQRREEFLISKGIKVIRFTNEEIKYNIDEVIRRILFECGVE
jgi:very-short-patch-repair endonuclease